MAPGNASNIAGGDSHHRRKRYSITELLEMRRTLPYVCCPVKNFKPEAWTEKILIKGVPPYDFLKPHAKKNVKPPAKRLEESRREGLTTLQQKQEALDHLIIQQKLRGAPPKPRIMPTIPEIPNPGTAPRLAVPAVQANPMRSVSANTGLSGGYGKRIVPEADRSLMTSMHAFVPGGTLKTAPITAVDTTGGSDWGMKEFRGSGFRSRLVSHMDGLGYRNKTAPASTASFAPAAITTVPRATGARASLITKTENVKDVVVAPIASSKAKVEAPAKPVVKPVVKPELKSENKLPVKQAKPLMGKYATNAEQLDWIQMMMGKPVISASQQAPKVKEALGAITEAPGDPEQFSFMAKEVGIYDELHDAKAPIVSGW